RLVWMWVDYVRHRTKLDQPVLLDDFVETLLSKARRAEAKDTARLLDELEKEIAGDEDEVALYQLIADGEPLYTRTQQARALGWTEAGLGATMVRLRRHTKAVRVRAGKEDEIPERDQSPSDPAPPGGRTRREGSS